MKPRFGTAVLTVCCFAVACAAAPAEDERPLRSIGFLVLPGVYNSELVAPYDVLQHLRFHVENAPEIFTVAPEPGPLKTFEGLELTRVVLMTSSTDPNMEQRAIGMGHLFVQKPLTQEAVDDLLNWPQLLRTHDHPGQPDVAA